MNLAPTTYDDSFKEAVTQWLPEWDFLWLKAQGYAESRLVPSAQSTAGAKGIMQIMDDTWYDVKQRLQTIIPSNASVFEPHWNIIGGVYYMSVMRNGWAFPRPEDDRRKLAFSSYNAGFGNILLAQKLSGGKADYDSIIVELPKVTGIENAQQTTAYVQRIYEYYQQFTSEEVVQQMPSVST